MPRNAQWWADWAWQLYEYMPNALEDMGKRCVPFVLPWRTLRVPVSILRGPTRHSGRPGTLLVAGTRRTAGSIPRRFFACPPQLEVVGSLPVWSLPSTLRRLGPSADMVVARVDRLSAQIFFRTNFLMVPEIVGTWLTVPDDLDALVRLSHSIKEDVRIVRRERLTQETSHMEADCEVFYHTMYVPFMRRRHGEFAVVRSLPQLRRAFHQGGIHWILSDGRRIAGRLFQQRNEVLHWLALGTADGEWRWVKAGAVAALYFFGIKHARDQRCTQIDLGGTAAVLTDGLLRYKRKWGSRLVGERQTHYLYLVQWERPTEQVTDFLADMPLIFYSRGRLAAVTALKSRAPMGWEQASQAYRSLLIPGLQRLFVLTSDNHELSQRNFTPSNAQGSGTKGDCEIVFCKADEFLHRFGGAG